MRTDVGAITAPLIAHYEFEGNAGAGVPDSSGNGHDGACVSGCPGDTGGKFGAAYNFNGSSNVISVPDASSLRPSAITVTIWVNLRSSANQGIVQKVYGAANLNSWQLMINSMGALEACAGAICTGPTLSVSLNAWHHLAYVGTGARLELYLDGVLLAGSPSSHAYDAGDITIGADRDNGVEVGFVDGYLDDVRIYAGALDAASIAALAAE